MAARLQEHFTGGQARDPVRFVHTVAVESRVEQRYFSAIHYLAMVCGDEALAFRLRSRPAWRRTSDDEYIARHVEFNRWLKENASTTEPPMTLLDTTEITVDESVARLLHWAGKIYFQGNTALTQK